NGHGHARACDLVITELLRLDRAQPGNHVVAERAGNEGAILLDQRDLEFWLRQLQRAGATGAAKTAADHDDAWRRLREGGQWKRQRRCRGRGSTQKLPPVHAMAL